MPTETTPHRVSTGSRVSGSGDPTSKNALAKPPNIELYSPSQDQLKKDIGAEIDRATFTSEKVVEVLCNKGKILCDAVEKELNAAGWSTDSGALNTAKWKTTKAEMKAIAGVDHYQLFAKLFMAILTTVSATLGGGATSKSGFYQDLLAIPYSSAMLDRIDDASPLKPDVIIGLRNVLGLTTGKKWWTQVEIPVEVKGNDTAQKQQIATYARVIFATKPYRSFVFCIAYNQTKQTIWFRFFHRGGLLTSPGYCLTQKEGWKEFVCGISGIVQWDIKDAGINPSRSTRYIFLQRVLDDTSAKFAVYKVEEVLYKRHCVRGRATLVERLQLVATGKSKEEAITKVKQFIQAEAESGKGKGGEGKGPKKRTSATSRSQPAVVKPRTQRTSPPSLLNEQPGSTSKARKSTLRDSVQSNSSTDTTKKTRSSTLAQKDSPSPQGSMQPGSGMGNSPTPASKPFNQAGSSINAETPAASEPPDTVVMDMERMSIRDSASKEAAANLPEDVILDNVGHEPDPFEDVILDKTEDVVDPLEDFILDNAEFLTLQGVPDSIDFPQTLVCKDSWSYRSEEENDGVIFKDVYGMFGVANVYGYTVVDDNKKFFQDRLQLNPGKEMSLREVRHHIRTFYQTCGRRLSSAKNPRELVIAVTHAMIGYYNLLKSGWLHRDISSGNVLIIEEEERIPLSDFAITKKVTKCRGVVTDGDLAKPFKPQTEAAEARKDKEISGTLPFMSIEMLKTWGNGEPHQHTPQDDLESFFWVLFWEYLNQARSYNVLTPTESRHLKKLLSTEFEEVLGGKGNADREFITNPEIGFCCSLFTLLAEWWTLLYKRGMEHEKLTESLLKRAFSELKSAKNWESWYDFFKAGSDSSNGKRRQPQPVTVSR